MTPSTLSGHNARDLSERQFDQHASGRQRVRQVLDTLVVTGSARIGEGKESYFVPR